MFQRRVLKVRAGNPVVYEAGRLIMVRGDMVEEPQPEGVTHMVSSIYRWAELSTKEGGSGCWTVCSAQNRKNRGEGQYPVLSRQCPVGAWMFELSSRCRVKHTELSS